MTRKVITVRWLWFAIALICCTAVRATAGPEPAAESNPAAGPLRVHPTNPRYFADGSGKAIYLTGSHTWNNMLDMGPGDPPPAFNFDAYLDFLRVAR